jgi:hypothetical protein
MSMSDIADIEVDVDAHLCWFCETRSTDKHRLWQFQMKRLQHERDVHPEFPTFIQRCGAETICFGSGYSLYLLTQLLIYLYIIIVIIIK